MYIYYENMMPLIPDRQIKTCVAEYRAAQNHSSLIKLIIKMCNHGLVCVCAWLH